MIIPVNDDTIRLINKIAEVCSNMITSLNKLSILRSVCNK